MIGKLLPVLFVLVLLWLLFFHRRIPRLTRKMGRTVGDLRDAGREVLGGEEVANSPLARYEAEVGKALTARLLDEKPLSRDSELQARVARIGGLISAGASRRKVEYSFRALDAREPNAMAVPGGFIFVTASLVRLCGDDDNRLAGVLGHEVAHIECLHAVKSYAAKAATRTGLRLLSLGRGAIVGRLVRGVEQLISSGYSREQELEADRTGSELAHKAGFDPLGVTHLLGEVKNLQPEPSCPAAEFLRYFHSHPPLAERIRALEKYWK